MRLRLMLMALALAAGPARAHLMPNSEISLEIGRSRLEAAIVIPLGELQYAEPGLRKLRAGTPGPAERQMISRYLQAHMSARSLDDQPWALLVTGATIRGEPSDLEARIELVPPAGSSTRRLSLRYDAVIDRLPNHIALLLLKSDFDAGRISDRPELLGALRQGKDTIIIERGTGSGWRGFAAAIGLGVHHIAEGHDHLLFLVALLLPAPLVAAGRRWAGYASWRKALRSLAIIVTAFTIGHSTTLVGGAVFDWRLPVQPVEILIALSILISAIHAWRPLFPGREALVAGGFGLVHGLAFATIIGRVGLDPWQKALSILGFNLGIELIQLLVVAAVMPGLILLARSRHYPPIRLGAATLAAVAASFWIVERARNEDFVPARLIDSALGYAPWLFAVGLAASAAMSLWRRISSVSRTS